VTEKKVKTREGSHDYLRRKGRRGGLNRKGATGSFGWGNVYILPTKRHKGKAPWVKEKQLLNERGGDPYPSGKQLQSGTERTETTYPLEGGFTGGTKLGTLGGGGEI